MNTKGDAILYYGIVKGIINKIKEEAQNAVDIIDGLEPNNPMIGRTARLINGLSTDLRNISCIFSSDVLAIGRDIERLEIIGKETK